MKSNMDQLRLAVNKGLLKHLITELTVWPNSVAIKKQSLITQVLFNKIKPTSMLCTIEVFRMSDWQGTKKL